MAPKQKTGGNTEKAKEVIQAVVIVESFDEYFQPLSYNIPRCLLPICNVPMLEYTLEFMATSGVQEVYLFCKSHMEKIKEYLKGYIKRKGKVPLISVCNANSSLSVGDVLRDVYRMAQISGHFILCSANVVSNINLMRVYEEHIKRQARDPAQIITLVLMEVSQGHRIESRTENAYYFLHPQTNQILHHHTELKGSKSEDNFPAPLEMFATVKEVEVRSDLLDTCIAICSKDVPQFFEDNFDYQCIRNDFVKGVLHSDIYVETMYAHILQDTSFKEGCYAAGVTGTAAYDIISRDIISRWVYPVCVDSNILPDTDYKQDPESVYKDSGVVLARQCWIEKNIVLGKNTHIEKGSRIRHSVLGDNCVVKSDSIVQGSYLFSNTSVGKGCSVLRSILGFGVQLLDNVKIGRGCMIGDNVILGPNATIPPFTRIAAVKKPEEFEDLDLGTASPSLSQDDNDAKSLTNVPTSVVGVQGRGFLWGSTTNYKDVDGDREDDYDSEESDNMEYFEAQNYCLNYMAVTMKDVDLKEADILDYPPSDDDLESEYSEDASDDVDSGIPINDLAISDAAKQNEDEYMMEAVETLDRAHNNKHEVSTALLELKSLRMAHNASPELQRLALMRWFATKIDWNNLNKSIKALVDKWNPLFEPVTDGDEAQIHMMWVVEQCCANIAADRSDTKSVRMAFQLIVRYLFDAEIISEDAILEWFDEAKDKPDSSGIDVTLINSLQGLIDYLQSSDEESEEDTDSEDEDSE
ncbi:translation initiation factor eIF-2B epsilon subunit, GEF [Mycoemilia scoparia]|uniref:Translation initiation factor eIF2B subunit epsilon n=1 Tax=Mycoemilia scoparia TaxID=417184 RepID=A0A9W8A2W2_9FUNG|nr:translation initiation factor eIF-2B epsilon subunit, GEF [Mycoemilia scoparia]